MIFTTYWFVAALAIFLTFYFLVRQPLFRRYFLLVFCIIFHGHFAGSAGVIPIVILGFVVFACGRGQRPWALKLGMILSVSSLLWYKYTGFLGAEVIGLVSSSKAQEFVVWTKANMPATPPLGISFFAFEFVHYLFDVLKGKKPIKSVVDFWSFTLFFPSLVAGPIKRYDQFLPALEAGLKSSKLEDVSAGVLRIAIGYIKKVMIADNLTAIIDHQYPQFSTLSFAARWTFVAMIALRILMDFSGYSDIAIGLARVIGVRLPENFNWPYLASDIREFWQRWHISLSSWIRDYVYIPIGGNRRGVLRTIFNGIFAFGLCGLWHGPTWNFVFWGLLHGFGLAVSGNYYKFLGPPGRALQSFLKAVPALSWLITMLFVGVGWLYFFYSFTDATNMVLLLWRTSL